MSITHPDRPGDLPVEDATPHEMLAAVREARGRANDAEVDLLRLAVAWAHAHPETPGDETWHAPRATAYDDGSPSDELPVEDHEWFGIPTIRWDAPAAFAAANGMSTTAGRAFLRDALVLAHRLPRTHARVLAGQVPVWRARRVAQAVLGKPQDVTTYVDQEVAPVAEQAGTVTLDHLVDRAMTLLYPEQRELDQLEALDARHATLHEESLNHTGVGDMTLRADWADLKDYDRALSLIAAALKRDGSTDSLDVRRSIAIGILADPARALALINGEEPPVPTKEVVAYVHLTDQGLAGCDPTAVDETGRTWLEETFRSWCARTDRFVTVRPVIDLNTHPDTPCERHDGTTTYAPSPTTAEKVRLRDRTCVFPHCTRRARGCDLDHVVAHAAGGPTCECNLAPLCRHHHRLKTHAGWTYLPLAPGIHLWREPHGQVFVTSRTGTLDLTDTFDTG
ncbi:HNH endonuclease signature motif containing protein [Nocardioides lijunqiniae]|uniref:HNH endonuclease signature motif containing protein n=1 Tax=Nocardioides lijunqiniae TaxID=2760832 RepID=UPI001877E66F|nr:HNH endonuclease signature motif containing protein [Nocardioides lijunqiniae]